LTAVLPSLPPGAAAQAASSLALIQRVDARAGALLTAPSCTAACVPSGPVTTPGTPSTPAPGDDLGTTPCTCTQTNGPTAGGTDGSTGDQPTPAPSPTSTPKPGGDNPQPSGPPTTSPKPSPTPTTLQDQIGTIVSKLPLPVTPPPLPLPDLPPLPVPVPTIHLPH
jgi:hypothetical protein